MVRRVSVVLDQKLKSVGSVSRQAIGGVASVAELCNRLDREVARKILEDIEVSDPDVALAVRNMMVTFDDLLLVDDVGIREVLKRIEKRMLAVALKGTIPELQERFYSNMSTKAAEALKEEIDFMGQVKLKDVTGAQREIVEVLRLLEEEGVVSFSGGSSEESYVA
ncbi:MAG: FliG C-terminal domain-containing protein [Pyrinomonadaceae bacterium]